MDVLYTYYLLAQIWSGNLGEKENGGSICQIFCSREPSVEQFYWTVNRNFTQRPVEIFIAFLDESNGRPIEILLNVQ